MHESNTTGCPHLDSKGVANANTGLWLGGDAMVGQVHRSVVDYCLSCPYEKWGCVLDAMDKGYWHPARTERQNRAAENKAVANENKGC